MVSFLLKLGDGVLEMFLILGGVEEGSAWGRGEYIVRGTGGGEGHRMQKWTEIKSIAVKGTF